MRKHFVAAVFGLATLALSSAQAETFIPVVPVPDGTSTIPASINDNNEIVGSFLDSQGVRHAFFGMLDGNYQTFEVGGDGALGGGIDDNDNITGYSGMPENNICDDTPFERLADGTVLTVMKGKEALKGTAAGLNAKGVFVGPYCDKNQSVHGYYGKDGKFIGTLTPDVPPGFVVPLAINNSGTVAGFYADENGLHGFLFRKKGETTIVNYPAAVVTVLEGVNDAGIVSGYEMGGDLVGHAFMFDPKAGTFKSIEPPGATSSFGFNINKAGLIAMSSDIGPFIYCPLKKKKCPASGAAAYPTHMPSRDFQRYGGGH